MAEKNGFFEFASWPVSCLIELRRRDLCPVLNVGEGSMLHGVTTRSDEKMKGSGSTGEPQSGDHTPARAQTLIPLLYKYTVGLLSPHLSLHRTDGRRRKAQMQFKALQTEPEEIHKRWQGTICDVPTKAKKRGADLGHGGGACQH